MSLGVKSPLALELALLGFLQAGSIHAYEIHGMLAGANALGLVWHVKQSNLYAHLARLEEAGLIESTTEPQGNRPPRKVLSPTPRGQAAFEEWVLSPVEHGRDFRLEFLAKLYFARRSGPTVVATLISRQRDACRGWLAELRAQSEAVLAERPYDWLVYEFRRGQVESILSWLDTCEATLTGPATGPATAR